jgi:hypothetical protein
MGDFYLDQRKLSFINNNERLSAHAGLGRNSELRWLFVIAIGERSREVRFSTASCLTLPHTSPLRSNTMLATRNLPAVELL